MQDIMVEKAWLSATTADNGSPDSSDTDDAAAAAAADSLSRPGIAQTRARFIRNA